MFYVDFVLVMNQALLYCGQYSTYVVNVLSQAIGHRDRLHEQTVVLVGGLRQTHLVRLFGHSLPVGHDGVALLDGDASVVFFQVLKKNFKLIK
jgi:hypothetical protein